MIFPEIITVQSWLNGLISMQVECNETLWAIQSDIDADAQEDSRWDIPCDQDPAGDW